MADMNRIMSEDFKCESEKGDDIFGIICGDLGMGDGLKPGGFLPINSEIETATDICCKNSSSHDQKNPSSVQSDRNPSHKSRNSLRKKSKSRSATESEIHEPEFGDTSDSEVFPTYADIPLGTSIRQQRKLYEKNLDSILRNHNQAAILMVNSEDRSRSDSTSSDSVCGTDRRRLSSVDIEKKLVHAVTEVEELKIELDACRRKLDAKYRAIAILKKQAEEARETMKDNKELAREYNIVLAKFDPVEVKVREVEDPQRDITDPDRPVFDLQQINEDYCRVCQENGVLMSKLEGRSEELRRLNNKLMALSRERDELLALMDVKERLRYEKSKSQSSEDEYGSFSAAELAVLGACRCRGNNPEPCGCAHAAASLRRDIIKLKEEIELQKDRTRETSLTVDAYRKAFEEQLHRNKLLSLKLAELSVPGVSKAVKAKAAIKWLISVLNDDDLDMTPNGMIPPLNNGRQLYAEDLEHLKNSVMPPQEIIKLLTDMVQEKNEALAHQKLATQILANKNKELEEKLIKIQDEEEVFKP